jgi:hypothetical protein
MPADVSTAVNDLRCGAMSKERRPVPHPISRTSRSETQISNGQTMRGMSTGMFVKAKQLSIGATIHLLKVINRGWLSAEKFLNISFSIYSCDL